VKVPKVFNAVTPIPIPAVMRHWARVSIVNVVKRGINDPPSVCVPPQSLFNLLEFQRLVLHYSPPARVQDLPRNQKVRRPTPPLPSSPTRGAGKKPIFKPV